MKNIQEVLAQKCRELRECQQQIACLKIVEPLLVEEGDKPPEIPPEPKQELRGWV